MNPSCRKTLYSPICHCGVLVPVVVVVVVVVVGIVVVAVVVVVLRLMGVGRRVRNIFRSDHGNVNGWIMEVKVGTPLQNALGTDLKQGVQRSI
jgi:hypothetical protein